MRHLLAHFRADALWRLESGDAQLHGPHFAAEAHQLQVRLLNPSGRARFLGAQRDHAERYRRHEIERARKLLEKGESPEQVIEQMSRALTNKLLHAPTHALHHISEDERDSLARLISRIYDLPKEP